MSDITRKEAIDWLCRLRSWIAIYIPRNKQECKQALDVAIASLETDEAYQLEYEQPESCEDCVPRKLVERIIKSPRSQEQMLTILNLIPSVLPKADSSVLEDIKAEIEKIYNRENNTFDCLNALDELKNFIDKHMEARITMDKEKLLHYLNSNADNDFLTEEQLVGYKICIQDIEELDDEW